MAGRPVRPVEVEGAGKPVRPLEEVEVEGAEVQAPQPQSCSQKTRGGISSWQAGVVVVVVAADASSL